MRKICIVSNRLSLWSYYSICVFVLTSCGHSVFRNTAFFDSYINLFEQESVIYGNAQKVTNLIIKFEVALPKDIAGRCTENATPLIQVNPATWNTFPQNEKSF